MELYLKVRLACSEGMSRRQAAKQFNTSRDRVAKMMSYSTPPGYQRHLPIQRPKLDAFVSTIDHWLDEDMKVPRKQRHTAKRVFDRLRDECGFTGGYTIIKDYMRERDQRRQEVFVPLSHPPGHGQADFGEAMVIIGGVERKAHFFVLDLPQRRRLCAGLPTLPKQHALVFGNAVNLPTTFRVRSADPLPASDYAKIVNLWFHEAGRKAGIVLDCAPADLIEPEDNSLP